MNPNEQEENIAMSRVVAGCVIRREDGKYLLVQEKKPSAYKLWNIPAGRVDKGETIEAAAVREVKEESGYDVELGAKIDIYHEKVESPVKHAFEAKITGGDLKFPPDEILNAGWFGYDEITGMRQDSKLRDEWIYDAISRVEQPVV